MDLVFSLFLCLVLCRFSDCRFIFADRMALRHSLQIEFQRLVSTELIVADWVFASHSLRIDFQRRFLIELINYVLRVNESWSLQIEWLFSVNWVSTVGFRWVGRCRTNGCESFPANWVSTICYFIETRLHSLQFSFTGILLRIPLLRRRLSLMSEISLNFIRRT